MTIALYYCPQVSKFACIPLLNYKLVNRWGILIYSYLSHVYPTRLHSRKDVSSHALFTNMSMFGKYLWCSDSTSTFAHMDLCLAFDNINGDKPINWRIKMSSFWTSLSNNITCILAFCYCVQFDVWMLFVILNLVNNGKHQACKMNLDKHFNIGILVHFKI